MPTDFERWRVPASSPWGERLAMIARMIDTWSHVLDVGAGDQALRFLLPYGCMYRPLDCVPTSTDTIVVDLNGPIPELEWRFDVAVLAGIVEYLDDPEGVLRRVSSWAPRLIVTYATLENSPGVLTARSGAGWLSHLMGAQLLDIFWRCGFHVASSFRWREQSIYDLRRR